jgi:hypothetical protein
MRRTREETGIWPESMRNLGFSGPTDHIFQYASVRVQYGTAGNDLVRLQSLRTLN